MLKALWFLARVAALTGAVVWFMRHPGTVEIGWQGYVVDTSVGFAAAALAVFLYLYTHAHSLWRAFTGAPRLWRRYREARARELGYRHVTAGLVAVAAGDAKAAAKYAQRGTKMIPDAPLARLLAAQSHLLDGNAPKARLAFAELLDDRDAAFFGVKALLQDTLQAGDHAEALQHIRRADRMQPGRAWIARALFDLEARNREWAKAAVALKKCARLGVFGREEARAHGQALLLAEGDAFFAKGDVVRAHRRAAEAFALDPRFTPAALRLVKFYGAAGKKKALLKAVLRAWAAEPHPALAAAWMDAMPARRKAASPYADGKDVYDWAQQLYRLNPDHRDSLRMMGAAALQARRWNEARDFLTRAADYRALARLEKAETGNEAKARLWLEEAVDAPPDPRWACAACGHVEEEWAPLCPECGGFNTAVWAVPQSAARSLPGQAGEGVHKIAGDVLSSPR